MSHNWNDNAPIYRQLKDRIVEMLLFHARADAEVPESGTDGLSTQELVECHVLQQRPLHGA